MRKLISMTLTAIVLLTACSQQNKQSASDNPFFNEFATPMNVPPFDKIKTEHYMPAFKEAIARQEKEIDAIVNNTEPATFANTIEALDYSGQMLSRVSGVFFNLNEANTNDSLQAIAKDVAPLLSHHTDNINMNAGLFKRIKAVYESKATLKLNSEQSKLLDETYSRFQRGGADLDDAKQKLLRAVNEKLSSLTLKFGENLLAETNAFKLVIDKKEDLAGLPQGIIDAAAEAAKENKMDGKWVFTLNNPSVMPFLTYSSKRELREKIWREWQNRGNNNNDKNNKKIIDQIVNLRLEKGKLLGFKDFADFELDKNMAKNGQTVMDFLLKIWQPALKVAEKEAKELQELANKEGSKIKIEPWDWRYYAEKLRKEKYDLDEEQLRPYFELESVKKGLFAVVNKLYGLKIVERKDIPVYHKDVTAYEIQDTDGSTLGILYMDFYPRASKRGGAWMNNYSEQKIINGKDIRPVIGVVYNFTKPTADQPALLTFEEVSTMYHEFGHTLHGLFSKCTYPGLSGTNVPRDFVEFPSQFMENWCAQPEVMNMYAKHYKTGEVIPKQLIDKLENSKYFNQGFATTEYLAASLLDMKYHIITDSTNVDPMQFEETTLKSLGLIPEIISRYRSTYFNHTFGGGYSAGYYSYIWAEVIDADAFAYFKEKGIFNQTLAQSLRENVLSKGFSDDPLVLYKKFRGAEPNIEPLLKRRGLTN